MSTNENLAQHQPPEDTFEDLHNDGWHIHTVKSGSGEPYQSIWLIPPGFVTESDVNEEGIAVYDPYTTPVVGFDIVEDENVRGITVEGTVQSWDKSRTRNEAFTIEGRSAGELSQRVIRALGAANLRACWAAAGGGLAGRSNYRDFVFKKQELEESQPRIRGSGLYNLAAKSSWTYNRVAFPLGMTESTGFDYIRQPRLEGGWVDGRVLKGYFVPPIVQEKNE